MNRWTRQRWLLNSVSSISTWNKFLLDVQPTFWYSTVPETRKNKRLAQQKPLAPMRLSMLVALNAGTSRREAERLIREGQVSIAGETFRVPQELLSWEQMTNEGLAPTLKVRGKAIPVSILRKPDSESDELKNSTNTLTTKVWVVHKLNGELVADSDPVGRPCLMPRLARLNAKKDRKQHLKPVGRLDMSTEGLILVTNDGQYARNMECLDLHRTYRVRAHGRPGRLLEPRALYRLQRGLVIPDPNNPERRIRYQPMKVEVDPDARGRSKRSSTNTWFKVTCTQGKNRQIRNVFTHFGRKCVVVVIAPDFFQSEH